MRDIDRPAADTGLVDFATFVLVLERWRSTYDPAVVLRSVWRRKVSGGDDTKVGVDVIKEVLTELHKPIPDDRTCMNDICFIFVFISKKSLFFSFLF